MDLLDVFRTLARYNKVANARLYEQCGKLELAEYRRERAGSFGSIHDLGNGHRSLSKERLEAFCGGRVLQLDNFHKLRGFGWPGFSRMRLWR